jgi:signal transduction histidine kinase
MADANTRERGKKEADSDPKLHFDVSTGLKRVLGRELITNEEVAIFEMVKNSFDADATAVEIFFGDDSIVVADNGDGMSYEDLKNKWLFVAYSEKRKRPQPGIDFRDVVADRGHYAGSKGIGRFSSDRLGEVLTLQTRPKGKKHGPVHKLVVNWDDFDQNDKLRFETIPVEYSEENSFNLPEALRKFGSNLTHGTIIEIKTLSQEWDRDALLSLKASLAKLINPFGSSVDKFTISITAPAEIAGDKKATLRAAKEKKKPFPKDIVNGRVGNLIFSDLQERTTFIVVTIEGGYINTTLTDRGEVIYRIREANSYKRLEGSGFRCEIYYLNQSAKVTFTRRVGLQPVQFGSVFLFRNDFRVYPIGEDGDDWFAFDRRKQQGYARFLGTREIIGRVDVSGSDEDFQETSSRNQGLVITPAVEELQRAVMEHGLKRLEKYVVPVSWEKDEQGNKFEDSGSDLALLRTDPGKARVSAAVANLVDNKRIELLEYSKKLVGLLNERSSEFESSLASLRLIAEKTNDRAFLAKLDKAEKRFDQLRKSEADAVKVADRALAQSAAATKRAETAEATAEHARRRAHFLQEAVNLDATTILNLHHQVTIYAVGIGQQIENFLFGTKDQDPIPRETVLQAMEQMAFLNQKVLAIARFAARANFQLDSERIDANLPEFITEYIENIARVSGSARTRIEVKNEHQGLRLRFNPIDISIIVDNLVSNARKAKASRVTFTLSGDKASLVMHVTDNGQGLARGIDRDQIFEMGYTTTRGSGLGLYHVRQVLGAMGGSIELDQSASTDGTTFIIRLSGTKAK